MSSHAHLRLDQLAPRTPALVVTVDWRALSEAEARRLRNMGLYEGVEVEALHHGPFGRDPIAVRIGRVTLAMRRAHARAIEVSEGAATA